MENLWILPILAGISSAPNIKFPLVIDNYKRYGKYEKYSKYGDD